MNATTIPIDGSILQVFAEDHQRLNELLNAAIKACRQSALLSLRNWFFAYEDGLCRHIHVEDTVLFRAFDAHTRLHDGGPTAVMRREHRAIERRLDEIGDALDGEPDPIFVERQLLALRALLADHDQREERILYPACDRFFTSRDRARIRACAHLHRSTIPTTDWRETS